jgi:hypothetical protein
MNEDTTVSPKWLEGIASSEEARRDRIGLPWLVMRGGEPWTVATDGLVLVMTRGELGYAANEKAPNIEPVLVDPSLPARMLPLATLRELAAPWLVAELPPCGVCESTGLVECDICEGEGDTECECGCGDVHDKECSGCDGTGKVGCKACARGEEKADEKRPVWIGDSAFDLRLFARTLPHIKGDTAQFRQLAKDRAASLVIGEWHLLVMPVRVLDGDTKWTDAPRVEPAPSPAK